MIVGLAGSDRPIRGGDDGQSSGGRPGADVAPERHAVPGDEGQFERRRRGAGQVPVEDPHQLGTVKAHVVRRDVVVPDQRGVGDGEEPPRPGVGEAGHGVMERPGPSDHRNQLLQAERAGVDIDHMPRQVGQHLPSLLVAPQDPGDVRDARGEVIQKGVHRRGPRARAPAHRVPDAHSSPHVAALQGDLPVVIHPRPLTAHSAEAIRASGSRPPPRPITTIQRWHLLPAPSSARAMSSASTGSGRGRRESPRGT